MNQEAEQQPTTQRSAGRDGLAAVAIALLAVGIIVFVVSSLV